jgi:DNA-binding response OmpR family regulator
MTKKPKLMVVDDEIDVCNFVKSFFEVRGFEVIAALDGDEAMGKLETLKPDVVLLDVKMRRDEEGIEYLARIRKKLPAARILMVTGVDEKEVIENAKKLGADDYITKPLVLEYLESTVLGKLKSLGVAAV